MQSALEALRTILDTHGETTILQSLSTEDHYTVMRLQGLSSRLQLQARATNTFRELLHFGGPKGTMHELRIADLKDQRLALGTSQGLKAARVLMTVQMLVSCVERADHDVLRRRGRLQAVVPDDLKDEVMYRVAVEGNAGEAKPSKRWTLPLDGMVEVAGFELQKDWHRQCHIFQLTSVLKATNIAEFLRALKNFDQREASHQLDPGGRAGPSLAG